MEITLEKIELVKDRTGVSYKEAKEALEDAGGSVVDAIIAIEEDIDNQSKKSFGEQGGAVIESVKDLVKKGNVSKIVVKNSEGDVILNIPVNAGIIGAVIAPWGTLAAVVAAFGFKCVIEVVKGDGTIIGVSDRTNDAVEKATEKGTEVYDKVKNSDTYEKVREKTGKATEVLKNKFSKAKDEIEDFAEDLIDEFEEDFEESEGEEK